MAVPVMTEILSRITDVDSKTAPFSLFTTLVDENDQPTHHGTQKDSQMPEQNDEIEMKVEFRAPSWNASSRLLQTLNLAFNATGGAVAGELIPMDSAAIRELLLGTAYEDVVRRGVSNKEDLVDDEPGSADTPSASTTTSMSEPTKRKRRTKAEIADDLEKAEAAKREAAIVAARSVAIVPAEPAPNPFATPPVDPYIALDQDGGVYEVCQTPEEWAAIITQLFQDATDYKHLMNVATTNNNSGVIKRLKEEARDDIIEPLKALVGERQAHFAVEEKVKEEAKEQIRLAAIAKAEAVVERNATLSLEDIRNGLTKLSAKLGANAALNMLRDDFGVTRATDLPKEMYVAFIDAVDKKIAA